MSQHASILTKKSQGTTSKQLAVLEAIRRSRELHPAYGPTYRELSDALGLSLNDVAEKVSRLIRDGLIERDPMVCRSLRVVGDE